MGSEAHVDEVRPAIEDRLGGEAHLTTALPGMLEVLHIQPAACDRRVPWRRGSPRNIAKHALPNAANSDPDPLFNARAGDGD